MSWKCIFKGHSWEKYKNIQYVTLTRCTNCKKSGDNFSFLPSADVHIDHSYTDAIIAARKLREAEGEVK